MPKKSYSKVGGSCRVTFELPAEVAADDVVVVGDFNEWSPAANQLVRRKDGRFSATVSLRADRSYRYRFLVDGHRWENDWAADSYEKNDFGSEDCIIVL